MVAHIGGPVRRSSPRNVGRRLRTARATTSSKCGLFSAIADDETIGRFLRVPDAVLVLVGAPRLVDQLAQRDRSAARLPRQPFPVPRQQRDLARDHAQFRPPGTAGRGAARSSVAQAALRPYPAAGPGRHRPSRENRDRPGRWFAVEHKDRRPALRRSSTALAARATDRRSPEAMQRSPSKAM